jgi:hypothetical protein
MHTHMGNTHHDLGGQVLLEVDFKWLMAGQGYTVDPDRLLRDPAYAHTCLECAQRSSCIALQECALCLQAVLQHHANTH